jgi:hypothetical protein
MLNCETATIVSKVSKVSRARKFSTLSEQGHLSEQGLNVLPHGSRARSLST